jgi:hypothetical protein
MADVPRGHGHGAEEEKRPGIPGLNSVNSACRSMLSIVVYFLHLTFRKKVLK